jgi:hypothetical protein
MFIFFDDDRDVKDSESPETDGATQLDVVEDEYASRTSLFNLS